MNDVANQYLDPHTQARVIEYYTLGYATSDVMFLVNGGSRNETALRAAQSEDPAFLRRCAEAMNKEFQPIVEHTFKLALKADADGELEGSHKALGLAMKHIDSERDRQHKAAMTSTTLEHRAQADPGVGGRSTALPPGGVTELVYAVDELAQRRAEKEADRPMIEEGDTPD